MKQYNSKKKKSKRRFRYYIAAILTIVMLGNSTFVCADEVCNSNVTDNEEDMQEKTEKQEENKPGQMEQQKESIEEKDNGEPEQEDVTENKENEAEAVEEKELTLYAEPDQTGYIEKATTKNQMETVGETILYENGASGECYLQAGDYTIEVTGAGGAASDSNSFLPGGNGGLVSGKFHFDKETTLSYVVGTGGTCVNGTSSGIQKSNGTPGGGKGYRTDDKEENISGGGGGYSAVMIKGEYLLIAGGGGGADSSEEKGGQAGEDGGSGGGQSVMIGANGNEVTTDKGVYAAGAGGGGYRGGKSHLGGTSYISSRATHTQMFSGKGASGGKHRAENGQGGTIKITWNACCHEDKKRKNISLGDYRNHKVVCDACKTDVNEKVSCTDEDENGFCDSCNQCVSPYFKEQAATSQEFPYGTKGELELNVNIEKVNGFFESLQWYCKKDGVLEALDGETTAKLVLQKESLNTGRYEYFCMMSYDGLAIGNKQSSTQTIEVTIAQGSIRFDESIKNNQLILYRKYNDSNDKGEIRIPYIYNADLDANSYGKGEILLQQPEQGIFKASIDRNRKELILQPVTSGEQELTVMATQGENYTACEQKFLIKVVTSFKMGDVLWDFTSDKNGNVSIWDVHKEDGSLLPEKMSVPNSFTIDEQRQNVNTIKTNTFCKDCGVKELTILEHVVTIEPEAIDKTIRIITVPGSAAEKYAKENGNPLSIKTQDYQYDVAWKDKEWVAEQYEPITNLPMVTIPEKVDGYPVAGFGKDAIKDNTEKIIIQGTTTKFPSDFSSGKDLNIVVRKDSLTEQSALENGFDNIQYLALGGIEAKLTADSIAITGNCLDTSKITVIGYWNQERTQSGIIPWDRLTTVPNDLTVHHQGVNKFIIGYYDAFTSFVINGYIPPDNTQNDKTQNHKKTSVKDSEHLKKHFQELIQDVEMQDINKLVDTDTIHISKDVVETLYHKGVEQLNSEQLSQLYKSELTQIDKDDVQEIVEKIEKGITVNIDEHESLETIEEKNSDYNKAYDNITEKERSFKKKVVVIQLLLFVLLFTVVYINGKMRSKNKGEQGNESESDL